MEKETKIEKGKKRGRTELWAILLVIVCTLFTSVGQLLLKLSSETFSFDLGLLTNYNLLAGLILYAIGAFLLIFSLKGGELSVLYPLIAVSFVWVALLSYFRLGESINIFKLAGIISIIIGVSFIGKGSKE